MTKKVFVTHADKVELHEVKSAEGVSLQVLLGRDEGMPRFYTRIFTMRPGASIPLHVHDTIEHEQFMLQGKMRLSVGDESFDVEPGNAMYLPAGVPHSYDNTGDVDARFICIVPAGIEYRTEYL